jgi:tetratricopeptide (TPR) repeat protein
VKNAIWKTMVLAFILAWPTTGRAAEDDGTASVFARGAGNSALALGGAFTAVANDASGWMWNPGGLGYAARTELQTSQGGAGELDVREYFVGFVMPSWRWGAVSFSYRQFGVDGIEARDSRNALIAADLADRETEFAIGYGRSFGPHWSLGGVAKMRSQELAGRSANGAGVDLGVSMRPAPLIGLGRGWMEDVTVGLAVQNIVKPVLRLDVEGVPDPTSARAGVAIERPMFHGLPVLAALDIERTQGRAARVHGGVQVKLPFLMDFRFGLNGSGTTAGAGFRYGNLMLDYAFEDNPVTPAHHVGLSMRFGMSTSESRAAYERTREKDLEDRLAEVFERRQSERIEGLLAKATEFQKRGDYDGALEAATTLLAIEPEESRAKTLQISCLLSKAAAIEKSGEAMAAALVYGQVLLVAPADSVATQGLRRCRATSDARAARSAEIRGRFAKALDAFTAGDLPAARTGLRGILEIHPEDVESRRMLERVESTILRRVEQQLGQAERLARAGLFDDAQSLLNDVRALQPGAEGLARASATLAQARQSAATHGTDATSRGSRTVRPGAPAPALSEQERGEIAQLYGRGTAAMRAGRSDEGVQYLELVRARDPGHRQAVDLLKREYLTRGLEAFAAGRLGDAVSWWEKALAADPTDERTRAYLMRARGHLERAAALGNR